MKGDPEVIDFLNLALKNELTAINQYFLHSEMYADWGLTKLAAKEREESIEEMKHAEELTRRILFLEGLPNLQSLDKLLIGENVLEVLQSDLKLEQKACPDLKKAILHSEKVGDFVSRDLFRRILDNEEEHIDWLETQLDLIERVGLERYTESKI